MSSAKRVVDKFGGPTALAKELGKGQSAISYWLKSGTIPAKWQSVLLELAKKQGVPLALKDFLDLEPTVVKTEPGMPFAKHMGVLSLGQNKIDCYVLATGERVITLLATIRAIAQKERGDLAGYIGVEALKPFIDADLILAETVDFSIPGTQLIGRGVKAEQFLEICNAYVNALAAGKLSTERQREIAVNCSILLSACAKVGLIALIDEATGYQYERAEDALQVKLRAFIAEELRAWEKTFPDELWEEFGRLTNWTGALHSRPKWWGKLVTELIYDTLDPDVAEYLKENKPPTNVRWFQQLTENVGVRQLVSRCYEVIGMAKMCKDMGELRQKVAEHYGKKPVQITLYLPQSSAE